MKFKVFIWLFFVLSSLSLKAQNRISGQIKEWDTTHYLQASVTLLTLNNETLIQYTWSDLNGQYAIDVASNLDSLLISISKMGYETIQQKIANKTQTLNFELRVKATELKEFEVKSPPIRRSGDTLSYKVDEFTSASDRTIADVMAKLPGINIDKLGKIYYQGIPINRYYINNLNLLDGRYNLANENLTHQKVLSIEVFENHQPIRVLDSLQFSRSAAINIKLKNAVTYALPLTLGLSSKPFLYEGNATPMFFTPQIQTLATFQSNNIGDPLERQIISHFDYSESLSPWLTIPALKSPALNSQKWFDNLSHLGGINVLKKTSKNLEIKLNSYLSFNNYEQNGQTHLKYTQGTTYTEIIKNRYQNNQFFGSVDLLKNTPKNYFSNRLSFEKRWNWGEGNNQRTTRLYQQNLKNDNYSIANNFHKIFSIKGNTLNFHSLTSYQNLNENLQIKFSEIDTSKTPVQNLNISQFSTDNYIQYSKKVSKYLNYTFKIGSLYQKNRLQSTLSQHNIHSDTSNLITGNYLKNSTTFTLNIPTEKWLFSTSLPFSHNWINFNEKLKYNQQKALFEPRLNIYYSSNDDTKYFLEMAYSNTLSQFGDIHSGYIMSNYLNLVRRNSDFRNTKNYTIRGGINYFNFINALSIDITYAYRISLQNLLGATQIHSDGSKEISYFEKDNQMEAHGLSIELKKNLFSLNTTISVNTFLSKALADRWINNKFERLSQSNWSPTLTLNNSTLSYLNISYQMSFLFAKNKNSRAQQLNQEIHIDLLPLKNTILRFSTEHIKLHQTYFLNDVSLRYTIPKIKNEIEISWNNFTNVKTFRQFYLSELFIEESTFQLRPRQVMIRTRLSL